MMSMQPVLNTSAAHVTADSPKGQRAVETFRAQYNKVGFDAESAQLLNEHPEWAAYLATGLRKFSQKGLVFPVYLEIEVGGKSKEQLLGEMSAARIYVSDYSKDIMGKPAWQPGETQTVKFARVKVNDLGFTNPRKLPKTLALWARLRELGSLCEPGDGPAIRLALKSQSRGDAFWIAMSQIAGSSGSPGVFCVRRDDGELWFSTLWVDSDHEWDLDNEIAFRLRK